MAKKLKKPGVGVGPITLTFDLFELPTAQHKAGLAGLLLQIESMKSRSLAPPTYQYDEAAPTSRVHVTLTEQTTAALFDDLYDATWMKGPPREKPFTKGKGDAKKVNPPTEMVDITKTDNKGNSKTVPGYVYLELTPTLGTLRQYLPKDGEWMRLWRDLIWQVIRDSKKKAPYIQRAKAKAQPKGASLDDDAAAEEADTKADEKVKGDGSTWADLVKHQAAVNKNTFAVGKLSSALLLGAQAENAEVIPFSGRIDHNLLLHFWPMTSMVYVPRFVDPDGQSHIGRRNKDDKSRHFCLAVPDVADLPGFLVDYPQMLAMLRTEMVLHRPKEALIDLPAESGLSFVEHLARLVPQIEAMADTRSSVSGIDYLHLNQDGNIVRLLSTGRVAYSMGLAEDYRNIVGRVGNKPPYGNPLFRRGLMHALLDDVPWYQPFGGLFSEWPAEFFVNSDHSPKKLSWFWADARKKFQEVYDPMPTDPSPTGPLDDDLLATTVHRLVRRYIDARLMKAAEYDFDKYRKEKHTPPDAAEARRKLAERLFLEFRSRRDQAFIDHFSGTFFSVGQYLGPKPVPRLFEKVAHALMHSTEKVKTLTLMALSATSWIPVKKKEAAQ